jgi:hypothetical protein
MISTRLRARWRALKVVLGLDLLRSDQHLLARAARDAADDKHVGEHRDSNGTTASGGRR